MAAEPRILRRARWPCCLRTIPTGALCFGAWAGDRLGPSYLLSLSTRNRTVFSALFETRTGKPPASADRGLSLLGALIVGQTFRRGRPRVQRSDLDRRRRFGM